ncbi:hypothetical protein C8J57DRAFT_1500385 [Mycena rebaudengoi]|nr:hypothetical protein C8J57DRAFT_1500385 [Mycena rebaudengoi]
MTSENAPSGLTSAAGTEFVSAHSQTGTAPESQSATTIATFPVANPLQLTLHSDENSSFIVDAHGVRQEVVMAPSRSQSSLSGDNPGIPMHPSNLFRPRLDGDAASSVESTLPESQPTAPEEFPDLALDINPDLLTTEQLGQLNAIRGVIGTANAQLLATTARVAEHQAATENMHDNIQAMRREYVAQIDSLRDEVNSQRSQLNRCLDDNLRLMKDTGASASQVGEILSTMNRNGGVHRRPREADPKVVVDTSRRPLLPEGIRIAAAAIIPPRHAGEDLDEFDKRAAAVIRTKERTHVAFNESASGVLGRHLNNNLSDPNKGFGRVAAARPREATGYAGVHRQNTIIANGMLAQGGTPIENDSASMAWRHAPALMNNTPSGYQSMAGGQMRDIVADFAAEMEAVIRTTIEHRVGHQVDLPPGVRAPKVDNPLRFKAVDDHDGFMIFLEKLLAWIKTNNCGGPDLDYYRITLLQNYLDEDTLKWFVREVDNPRKNDGITRDFADVVCYTDDTLSRPRLNAPRANSRT